MRHVLVVANRTLGGDDLLRVVREKASGRADRLLGRGPQHAVRDALAHHEIDEIIVSTLPGGVSHWLRLDLPKRLQRRHHLPVTTVTVSSAHP
jgi:hypothetical protein